MGLKVYVTQNRVYSVHHSTPTGREVIISPNEMSYAIVGFADPEKLGMTMFGDDGYWYLKSTGEPLNRGSGEGQLEKQLEKTARPGLRIVDWLVDEKGDYLPHGLSHTPNEMVTSALKEVREE